MRRFRSVAPFLLIINVLVFWRWHTGIKTEEQAQWMIDHFMVSWSGLQSGHYETLITSVFSHMSTLHFVMNMLVLSSFIQPVQAVLGASRLLRFYVVAGILSSFCHAFVSNYLLHQPDLPALGASGALSGVVLLFALIYPREKLLVFGLIPVPALWGSIIFVGLDIWGLVAQAEGGGLPIGHGAHLGGALTGILYYFFFLRKHLVRRVERSL